MANVDLGTTVAAPQSDDELLGELIARLAVAMTKAEGAPALQQVVEGLAIGFLIDDSPQAKAVVRALILGVNA